MLVACRSPSPNGPAPTCTLDNLLGDPAAGVRVCDENAGGVCGYECAYRIHACVLTSLRDRKPFDARWTNNMIDGVGTQEAIVGRLDGEVLDVRWYELTAVSGYDPHSRTTGDTHFRVTVRRCSDITAGTDTRGGNHLDLRCAPDVPEEIVCRERL
jgi:hypothetical protein